MSTFLFYGFVAMSLMNCVPKQGAHVADYRKSNSADASANQQGLGDKNSQGSGSYSDQPPGGSHGAHGSHGSGSDGSEGSDDPGTVVIEGDDAPLIAMAQRVFGTPNQPGLLGFLGFVIYINGIPINTEGANGGGQSNTYMTQENAKYFAKLLRETACPFKNGDLTALVQLNDAQLTSMLSCLGEVTTAQTEFGVE